MIFKRNFKNNLPTISIVSSTYKPNLRVFEKMLKALKEQTYPRELIEHIIMDSGLSEDTIKLAKKYGCKTYVLPNLQEEEQTRASLGFKKARGDIILIIEDDNIVTSKNWMMKMVQPFLENKNVFCTYTLHYTYEKNMSITTRYGALIGANDPLISPYFLDKIEKIPMTQDHYNKGQIISETKDHYIVKFKRDNFPPLGDNGQMVLRSAMNKVNKNPKTYVHTDAFGRMFDLGYDTCGVVKDSTIHIIGSDIMRMVKRRLEIKDKFYDWRRKERRYHIFDWNSKKDRLNMIKFVIFSITIIPTLYQSVRGYLKIRDTAWFIHPFMCLLMLSIYGYSEMRWFLLKSLRKEKIH